MKQVGIYRTVFPSPSETFIGEQASSMTRYKPIFLMRSKLKNIKFNGIAISDNDFLGIKQKLYTLTRSSLLFGKQNNLEQLNLVHAHFGPDGVYAMELANKLEIPFVVTCHGGDITSSHKAMFCSLKPSVYQFLLYEKELKNKAKNFIAVSQFIEKRLREKGYPPEKIIQHYIGVDIEKFSPVHETSDERYILSVGRHTQKKGIDTLIRAFARIAKKYPAVSLIQVGAGSMTTNLHTLATELGVENQVRFLGAQAHAVVLQLMRRAEIFALTSQTAESGDSEALGIVFNEASACRVPIVSTWHGGIPEAVVNGETGLLAPEKDDKGLAEKLDILLSDRSLGQEMGRRGREYVCELFDIRKQTVKLEAIYDKTLSS